MGRPPWPPEIRRRNRVVTFVTDTELAKLERMADEEGKPLAAIIYHILSRSLKRRG
jgi:hypothetical protein